MLRKGPPLQQNLGNQESYCVVIVDRQTFAVLLLSVNFQRSFSPHMTCCTWTRFASDRRLIALEGKNCIPKLCIWELHWHRNVIITSYTATQRLKDPSLSDPPKSRDTRHPLTKTGLDYFGHLYIKTTIMTWCGFLHFHVSHNESHSSWSCWQQIQRRISAYSSALYRWYLMMENKVWSSVTTHLNSTSQCSADSFSSFLCGERIELILGQPYCCTYMARSQQL